MQNRENNYMNLYTRILIEVIVKKKLLVLKKKNTFYKFYYL